ncbi:hypothetical protein Mgra_00006852 [Meloidogyne graminicola]|uniref:aECM cysteine-cradle domain-containing protein n=1 Tax=Meloidogyne graminicola TaxID=189291 RepID=A0A8S9ZKX5_9BILA|nr:hypothetical protein Mgra_00006852 [Meloidogyne graminicola]
MNKTSKKSNNLKLKNKTTKKSIDSSPRLIRQIVNDETDGIKKPLEKPKRYKCFLIDDEDEEEGKEIKNEKQQKLAIGQNSYFAGFLKDGEENNELMGWEEPVKQSDNPRRSEGINMHYSLKSIQDKEETTKMPIIEYVDDYEASPQKEDELEINSADLSGSSYSQPSQKWETIPAVKAKFLTKNDLNVQKTKNVKNYNSIESSASFEDKKQRKQQIDEETNYNEKMDEEGEDESEEDFYSDEDNYSSTTIKTTKINKNEAKNKDSQRNVANGGSPRAKVFPGLAKITPTNSLLTTRKPEQFTSTKKAVEEIENKEKKNGLLNKNKIKNQQNNAKQQQKYEERLTEVKIPPIDSQGRPLILSPEHCKMIGTYAQLYGATPGSVISFVRNNCAFVKMYLPTASCSEIETLVKSCYERKIMMRGRQRIL